MAAATAAPSSAPAGDSKPAHDVLAGAMARAASQSTIHPLDTMKVRMQTGRMPGNPPSTTSRANGIGTAGKSFLTQHTGARGGGGLPRALSAVQHGAREVASLYKGVVSAAAGAGLIIGAYFAFYSTSKRALKQRTHLSDGQVAFFSGAVAAVGSGVVKVPIAVCIRSVQAGVYPNVVAAGRAITSAAGVRGLFTGFLPTLLEDVPDMAVKFAVYETVRPLHHQISGGREPSTLEDLAMGGAAGAAAAAATTPLDVVKTRMMCSASSRPTLRGAVAAVMAEGGAAPFFRGIVPRAVSNGLNSAVFFCFFEAIRRGLVARQQEEQQHQQAAATGSTRPCTSGVSPASLSGAHHHGLCGGQQRVARAAVSQQAGQSHTVCQSGLQRGPSPAPAANSGRLACLSLAIPVHGRP